MSIITKKSPYILADIVAKLHLGSLRKLRYILIDYNKISIIIVNILYKEGIIRLYTFENKKIMVYYKYFRGCRTFKFKLISKPSKRIYYNLNKLSLIYNKYVFSGFFVISTSKGIFTSHECLLQRRISGEILFKVYL